MKKSALNRYPTKKEIKKHRLKLESYKHTKMV